MEADTDMALEQLLAGLESEARSEVDEILAAAADEAARIRAANEDRLERARAAMVAPREAELRRQAQREVLEAKRMARDDVLGARQRLLDRVLAAAVHRLPQEMSTPRFRQALRGYLAEALAFLGAEPAVVRCPPELTECVRALIGPERSVDVQGDAEVGSGVVLESQDGSLLIDNTLEARLQRMQPVLALEVLRRVAVEP